jgi:hypothetical protein
MDHKMYEKAARKIVDIFSDSRIDDMGVVHTAMYTANYAYPSDIAEKIIEFGEHLKYESNRLRYDRQTLTLDYDYATMGA